MTAMLGNINASKRLSESSEFVKASSHSPHMKRLQTSMANISKRNNFLTEDEMERLRKQRKDLYQEQVIGKVTKESDIATTNRNTATMMALTGGLSEKYLAGKLILKPKYAKPILKFVKRAFENKDYERTYIASDDDDIVRIGNLSFDDKRRLRVANEVLAASEEDDPFLEYDAELTRREAAAKLRRQAAEAARNGDTKSISAQAMGGSGVDWSQLL